MDNAEFLTKHQSKQSETLGDISENDDDGVVFQLSTAVFGFCVLRVAR